MTTATRQPETRKGRADRVARIVAVAAGMFFLIPGLWAFFAPASFFEAAATFDPYNTHLIRDIGAFQIGFGAVLVLSAFVRDALLAGLAGVGPGRASTSWPTSSTTTSAATRRWISRCSPSWPSCSSVRRRPARPGYAGERGSDSPADERGRGHDEIGSAPVGGIAFTLGVAIFLLSRFRHLVGTPEAGLWLLIPAGFALWIVGLTAFRARYGPRARGLGGSGLDRPSSASSSSPSATSDCCCTSSAHLGASAGSAPDLGRTEARSSR
jgi:hypothetical protein